MGLSPVILHVSHYRQIRLRPSTILRVLCSEGVGRMKRLLITKKRSSCGRTARMPMQIWEAGFLQRAASEKPSLRNGSEAVLLAEQADSESSRSENHPMVLRILAAAYAESGRFGEAKQTAQQALQAAEIQGNATLANALRDEIALYDLGLPYHKER